MSEADQPPAKQRMIRRPGLYRRWELLDAMGVGERFHFEEFAETREGTTLFALYDIVQLPPDQGDNVAPLSKGQWVCLPGLHRRSEVKLPSEGGAWRIEYAGLEDGGEQLLRVYHLAPAVAAIGTPGSGDVP